MALIPDDLFTSDPSDLTADLIKRVANTPERDLRGYRTSLMYHFLAHDMHRWIYCQEEAALGDLATVRNSDFCATWFCFSTWASITVNRNIRGEQLPYRASVFTPSGWRRRFAPIVLSAKSANRQRFMQLLSWAQRLVFVNTTLTYLAVKQRQRENEANPTGSRRFAERDGVTGKITLIGGEWTEEIIDASKVAPSERTVITPERDTNPVAMAFEYYRRARMITAAMTRRPALEGYYRVLRTRLILLGNLAITALEQDVVGPGDEEAIHNPSAAAFDSLAEWVSEMGERTQGVPEHVSFNGIRARIEPVRQATDGVWIRLLTRELLVLALPAEVLRLGKDIPPREPGARYFPPDTGPLPTSPRDDNDGTYATEWIQHRRDSAELDRLIASFDRSEGDGFGTAARDWTRYTERMNWATALMRSRVHDSSLMWPPFRAEDIERILEGRLPLHHGDPTDHDVLAPMQNYMYRPGGGVDQ